MANAVKTIEVLQKSFPVSEQQIQNGLQNVNWHARLQRLNSEDFNLPKTTELYLDGGHNEAAAAAIASQLGSWKQNDNRALYVVLGMMDGKDTARFSKHLEPFADEIYCVNIENEPQSQTAQELQNKIPIAKIAQNYQIALSNLQDSAANARILICGSLYLSGQVLQHASK